MFNLLLALIVGLLIGWNFHAFFIQLNPPSLIKNTVTKTIPTKIISQKIESVAKTKIPKEIKSIDKNNSEPIKNIKIPINENFYSLLEQNLFSDAMGFYVDASTLQRLAYNAKLLEFFEKKSMTQPKKAIEEMLEYQELENSENRVDLEKLQEVEDYAPEEKAIVLFNLIQEKIDKTQEYEHAIELSKESEHFMVNVKINNTPLTLLLDTGATLTMVNKNKISLLSPTESIILNTAGGLIHAELQKAETFALGEIELKNFKIVSAKFEQKNADGLLGMNFFKKFKFKIDQEKSIFYTFLKNRALMLYFTAFPRSHIGMKIPSAISKTNPAIKKSIIGSMYEAKLSIRS